MSRMTADERAELFQVSKRYRQHDEWKRAQRGGDATTSAEVENLRRSIAKAKANAPGAPVLDLTDITPIPFVDDMGNTYLDGKNQKMMRPAGMDPHFFVAQGLRLRGEKDLGLRLGSVIARWGLEAYQIYEFRRGGPWDAQRVGRKNHKDFVDYATVAIGLYAAAAGIPKDDILWVENYVAKTSRFDTKEQFDKTFIHLPTRNVHNTDTGYRLYQSGLIGAEDPKP